MKRGIIIFVAMVLVMMTGTITSQAKVTKLQERNVQRFVFDIEDDYEYEEELKEIIDLDVTYSEMGYGIYDVKLQMTVDKDVYEYHVIYDGVEDDDIADYGIYKGERVDSDRLEEIMIAEHPILADY